MINITSKFIFLASLTEIKANKETIIKDINRNIILNKIISTKISSTIIMGMLTISMITKITMIRITRITTTKITMIITIVRTSIIITEIMIIPPPTKITRITIRIIITTNNGTRTIIMSLNNR